MISVSPGRTGILRNKKSNSARDEFAVSFTQPVAAEAWPIHYEIDDVLGRTLTSGETSDSRVSLSARAQHRRAFSSSALHPMASFKRGGLWWGDNCLNYAFCDSGD
jgi:hypothetical protein